MAERTFFILLLEQEENAIVSRLSGVVEAGVAPPELRRGGSCIPHGKRRH